MGLKRVSRRVMFTEDTGPGLFQVHSPNLGGAGRRDTVYGVARASGRGGKGKRIKCVRSK